MSITPEITSKNFGREILKKLLQDYKSFLGQRVPAYDGKKSIYTAGPLPFSSKEFVVEMDREKRGSSERYSCSCHEIIKFLPLCIISILLNLTWLIMHDCQDG